jgi:DNA-binding transcriptional regulator YdaS (Cro superfamily)
MMNPETNPVEVAIQAVGSQQTLADFLGVSRPTISYWKKQREIPMDWIEKVQKVTQIPLHLLFSELQSEIAEKVRAEKEARLRAIREIAEGRQAQR